MKSLLRILSVTILFVYASFAVAQTAEQTDNGMTIKYSSTMVRVQFYSPEIVRITKYRSTDTKALDDQKYVVDMEPQTDLNLSFTSGTTAFTVKSDAMEVTFNRSTKALVFKDANGRQLVSEKASGTQFTSISDGGNASYKVSQTFQLESDEVVYGLGQLQNGQLNRRNSTFNYMIQGNTSIWIPYIHSVKGYGIYWDIYSPTTYTDNSSGMKFESSAAHAIDYYILAGSPTDGDLTVKRMRELTGKAQMVPLWTYGYFQSKERYQSADETMGVVKKYRSLGVPLDCVVQDWQYWGGTNYWNAMEFLNPQFTNYKQMVSSVHNNHAKILISVWADFGPDTKEFKWLKEHNYLIKRGNDIMSNTWPTNAGVGIYNPYAEEARQYYWDCLKSGITMEGFDAYWMDSSEPDHYEGGNDLEKTMDFKVGDNFTWRSVRNAFPLLHVEGVGNRHKADSETNGKRVMIMTRSGYPGQQRVGAASWSGDVQADWETLRKQIPAMLNFTVCGIPGWNSDTGGFFGGTPGERTYNELYTRWAQFSTFCSIMRSHGSGVDRAIYQFGDKGTPTFDAIEKTINLRYALLPYIYSTAHQIYAEDFSLMRALGWAYPTDKTATLVADQFLFGKSMLVAPVVEAGAKSRSVYLPGENEKWYDFWTGEQFKGQQTISRSVDISTTPLYIHAGSIVPWGPKVQYSDEQGWDSLEIRVYPGADGEFTLYEDEFDGYNYEKGICSEIPFSWNEEQQQLTIGQRKGSYPGMKEKRRFRIVLVDADENMGIGNRQSVRFSKIVEYDGNSLTVGIDNKNTVLSGYKPISSITLGASSISLFPGQNGSANVTAKYTDGTKEDVNNYVTYRILEGEGVVSIDGGLIHADAEGTAKVEVVYTDQANQTYTAVLTVKVAVPSNLYSFKANQWTRVTDRITSDSNIKYDRTKNTITVTQPGSLNTALRYDLSSYIAPGHKYFIIHGSNLSTEAQSASIWFFNNEWVDQFYPTTFYTLQNGEVVIVWDVSSRIDTESYQKFGQTLFGLTSTSTSSVIRFIGFVESVAKYMAEQGDVLGKYEFKASDWKTGDPSRVSQSNISYNSTDNTITLRSGTGANNVCLQLSGGATSNNIVTSDEHWMIVVASNVSTTPSASFLWWLNGVNYGSSVAPTAIRTTDDGSRIVIGWDMTTTGLDGNNVGDMFSICQGNTIFGLTSTTGTSTVYHIGFHPSFDEFFNDVASIDGISMDETKTSDTIYDLNGRRIGTTTPPKGVYIIGGKKIVK